ncbi:hypothetical protein GWI33_023414 [Rhynchophorus ferrugineus]|uniref:Uncharacterized protein n=1 Tax=Rhynchophorus ferrugineus TaxID=354439 RepID=A0A834IM32_RHYFE|nr:hypothetical protein GWI33_023414 [Rhynchophorus ferrugineus]
MQKLDTPSTAVLRAFKSFPVHYGAKSSEQTKICLGLLQQPKLFPPPSPPRHPPTPIPAPRSATTKAPAGHGVGNGTKKNARALYYYPRFERGALSRPGPVENCFGTVLMGRGGIVPFQGEAHFLMVKTLMLSRYNSTRFITEIKRRSWSLESDDLAPVSSRARKVKRAPPLSPATTPLRLKSLRNLKVNERGAERTGSNLPLPTNYM